MKAEKNKKNKTHTVYKNELGKRVPSVTTIVGLLNKPYLMTWANKLGLGGMELSSYMDDLARVGTLAHAMIQAYFTKEEVCTDEYTKHDISRAENSIRSFKNWVKANEIKPIFNERSLHGEEFGGTVDMLAEVNGELTLVDFKTGSGIYNESFIQLAGYKLLLKEYKIKKCLIVRVGRDEQEGFEIREVRDTKKYERIFKHLLAIYKLQKK
jgi:hypothetical protein